MWSALGRWVLQGNRPHCAERLNGLANRRRRSGSSTPGHVRPEGTAPLKTQLTSAETAPAHTQQHTGTSGRGGAVLASVPAGTAASEGPPPEPPATPGAERQWRQRVCTGFPGCFLFWGRLRELVAGVGGRLLLCVGELRGSTTAGYGHATGQPPGAPAQEDGEDRRRKLPPASRQRRKKWGPPPSTAEADTTTTAAMAARGDGRQPRREHRHRWRPAAAPAHRKRAGPRTGNIPDNASYFASPHCPTTGQRPAHAIAQASHNFMERRLPGSIRAVSEKGSPGLRVPTARWSRPADHVAVLHHELDFAKLANVGERVATDRDDIGEFSGFDCADAAFHAEQLGGVRRGGADHFDGRHSAAPIRFKNR